ncbi:MAG: malto-oligosyltrehalose synthase [Gemmatimonadaceae bacterium]
MGRAALTATYRVQLNEGFRLADARAITSYLERLGISHLYASPILAARPGSTHGYDVADPTRLNPELGTEEELRALATDLQARAMGIVLDIVPNHMGTGPANPFWEDLLARGRRSPTARWFDVDWDSERASLHGRVLVPILGDTLEDVLDRGELSLVRQGEHIRLAYFDQTFPLSPETESSLESESLEAWHKGKDGRKRMRELVDSQRYRLAFWKRASIAINYRRFFDVNELIALRAHDPAVFLETHAPVLRWVEDGVIDALRIDHIDGLLDPQGYLDSLRVEVTERRPAIGEPFPIFVEKILSPGERLRQGWPVQGTTGYEALNDVEAAFIDADGASALEKAYRRMVGTRARGGFGEAAVRGKELVLRAALSADVSRLVLLLKEALEGRRVGESRGLAAAIRHFIATLPVYRTYLDHRGTVHADDAAVIDRAVERARERWGKSTDLDRIAELLCDAADEPAQRFIGRLQQTSGPATAKGVEDTALYRYVPLASLNEVGGDPVRDLTRAVEDLHRANAERARHWPMSLVTTSTHDTKRGADVRSRLDVLSEMPDEWIAAARRWRRMLARHRQRVRRGPAPDAATEWLIYQTMLGIWPADVQAQDALRDVRDRVVEYMTKANREAKVRTSWTSPDEAYERAVERYVDAALASHTFVGEMAEIANRVAPAGYCNALSRLLVHLTAPGTPDIYQGDETWNFTLVDPDNRRPVDYDARSAVLDRVEATLAPPNAAITCADMLREVADGRLKMHVTRTALRLRRQMPDLFSGGSYQPLSGRGDQASHLLGFMRRSKEATALTAVTRRPFVLGAGEIPAGLAWGDAAIILQGGDVSRRWRCVLTDRTVEGHVAGGDVSLALREVFLTLPVALLVAV